MSFSRTLSLALPVALIAGSAAASITSVSGNVTQIGAPLSAMPGALTALNAWAWNEQQNVVIPPTWMDLTVNPGGSGSPTPAFVNAQPVSSHFIHYDGFPGAMASGTVTFNAQILFVQYTGGWIDLTDSTVTTGTLYPTTNPTRGFAGGGFININTNTLTFMLFPAAPSSDVEQIRVFTRVVPTPGSAALLGLGGLLTFRRRR